MAGSSCGCGGAPPRPSTGPLQDARCLSTRIGWRDRLGGWRVRWGIGRMSYRVPPGVYRIGSPNRDSPVLVTANYKLTVDAVRRELAGLDVWLLVLDTAGVNVWCAAGKGTFGTGELVSRIRATRLAERVNHRTLVLPQLGAPGVAAHEVKRETGFTVSYGPIRARDLPAYLAGGLRATPAMRRITFGFAERLVLAPIEIVAGLKWVGIFAVALMVLELVLRGAASWNPLVTLAPFLAAVFAGGVLVPALLPWLPTRIFAIKGAVAGALCVGVTLFWLVPGGAAEGIGTALLATAIAAHMGMLFTGSTTFTNLAGVRLEVRWALPIIAAMAISGIVLRIVAAAA